MLRFLRLSSLMGLLWLVVGCASNDDPTAGWTVEKLHEEAKSEMAAGAYEKAIGLYDKLEGRAAGTVLSQQAQLEKAFAQYKNNEPILAVATLDRFIRLNPVNPALDYALYLKGTINFNDDLGLLGGILKPDLSERDQMAARQSFEAFKELVTRFPDSRYATDSIARMQYIVNTLARSELNVAKYYLRTGACVAAVNRAQTVVQDFPTSESIEEALGILMRCYDTLGLSALRDDNKRILEKNFPNSPLLGKPIVKVAPTADPIKKPWWKLW